MTRTLVSAAVCPHPPLLLRELGGGHDSVPALRTACGAALDRLLRDSPDTVVVVGRAVGTWSAGELPDGAEDAPGSLSVARRLLSEAGWTGRIEWQAIAADADAASCDLVGAEVARGDDRVALLVMADGSASRTPKAPGYFDERAEAFDASVVKALQRGEPEALRHLDSAMAEELLMQGRPALHVLGAAVHHAGRSVAGTEVHYLDDPFGVLYYVVTWTLRRGSA
ncbi:hypothetical protein VSH64_08975 [Amycolatopsis rhabdoformis]|uniref:Uncharacterized protein n=1 Tax=Amycolatopsis rhabdoformis TaxID=1448059 RepID=A0ABZ1ICU0_9PSEU|nr:hypothetical protein [Amycolatopsis rhabdoformis]WSE32240.1 hypothetical protein VSH64_08975 [Amycolatopsis rhabdoformis]